jgi:hypothetical protein
MIIPFKNNFWWSFLDPLFRHTIPEVQKSAQTLLW